MYVCNFRIITVVFLTHLVVFHDVWICRVESLEQLNRYFWDFSPRSSLLSIDPIRLLRSNIASNTVVHDESSIVFVSLSVTCCLLSLYLSSGTGPLASGSHGRRKKKPSCKRRCTDKTNCDAKRNLLLLLIRVTDYSYYTIRFFIFFFFDFSFLYYAYFIINQW